MIPRRINLAWLSSLAWSAYWGSDRQYDNGRPVFVGPCDWNWKHIGKIEAGRDANILVLSHNPLESLDYLKEIDLLFLEGKKIDRAQLLKK